MVRTTADSMYTAQEEMMWCFHEQPHYASRTCQVM